MNDYSDGNVLGRVGAITLIILAVYGVHRLNCGDGMCPVMRTDSCCSGEKPAAEAPAPAK